MGFITLAFPLGEALSTCRAIIMKGLYDRETQSSLSSLFIWADLEYNWIDIKKTSVHSMRTELASYPRVRTQKWRQASILQSLFFAQYPNLGLSSVKVCLVA